MADSNQNHRAQLIKDLRDGYEMAVRTVDAQIASLGVLVSEPFIALKTGIEYADGRMRGRSHEAAKEAAVDWFYDATDRNMEFCHKHASKARRAYSIAHGFDAGIHDIGDLAPSTPSPDPLGHFGNLVQNGSNAADVALGIVDAGKTWDEARLAAARTGTKAREQVPATSGGSGASSRTSGKAAKSPKKHQNNHKKHKVGASSPRAAVRKPTARTIGMALKNLPPSAKVVIFIVIAGTVVAVIVVKRVRRRRAIRLQSDNEQVVSSPGQLSAVNTSEEKNPQTEAAEGADLYVWLEPDASDVTQSP